MDKNQDLEAIDWSKIDLEKAKFILQESEKLMCNTSQAYDVLDNKIASMRTFIVAVLSLIFTAKSASLISFSIEIVPIIIGMAVALLLITISYRTKLFPAIGTGPDELAKYKYNTQDLRWLICCQLQTYSIRITEGKQHNQQKGKYLNLAINILVLAFVLSATIFTLPLLYSRVVPLGDFLLQVLQ